MQSAVVPRREARRLEALRAYQPFDTTLETAFDDLTALAARICETPISAISLIDRDTIRFISTVGWPLRTISREASFCAHAILESDVLVIPDAALDARFTDSPLIAGETHVRFYAGVPLTTADGHAVGVLCVMDHAPRSLSASQRDTLRLLGRQVMTQLDLRRQTRVLAESEARLRFATDNAAVGLVVVNEDRRYAYANTAYAEMLGLPARPIIGARVADVLGDVYQEQISPRLDRGFAGERITYELRRTTPDGDRHYAVRYEPRAASGGSRVVVVVITEITELKAAASVANRLAAIVESSDDAIIGKDVTGTITTWNAGAERLFGYHADEIVGQSILRLIPDDRQGEELEILDRIRRGESVTHLETVRRTKRGQLLDVSITTSPIKDATGRIIGASKVARDITARKEAEAALRASEARYRTLFDYAPDGIIVATPDGRYLDVNPSICEMLGYSRDELLALRATDLIVPSELPDIEKARRIIEQQPSYQREWRFRRKDGSVFPVDLTATRMPDGNRLGMIRDVSERNRVIEALRNAEERMRFALQNASVGIWDMDYRTGVLEWSETLEAQYGLAPGTFAGSVDAFIERVHPDDRAALLETLGKAMQTGFDFTTENRALWPDKTVRWLSGAGRILLDEHRQPLRGVGISLDVTERRTLEAQYQQAQKMEAVGRLAGAVAHDFNNLLTAINGYCELLLETMNPTEQAAQDIAEIQKAGTTAAGLTRQLLTFSRKQVIDPALIDLNLVVGGMEGILRRLIGEDVAIVLAPAPGPALAVADRGQMEQVILNLVVNARDAMPKGGRLTIETAHVELDEYYASAHIAVTPGRYVALTVTDTGTGMPPDVQAHLFEPFFTTKESGKGTGLGLATVHGIVTRSGGSISVYSEVGSGTSFRVYLPQADAASIDARPQIAAARSRRGTQTVLVVEDSDSVRDLARRLLERQGYTVLLAANADEAIRLFERHATIEVLLTDVVMPGASGPDLTRSLIEQRPGLKVIYMSGYTEEAIVQHGVLEPGVAFLHKPFTSETLGRKLRDVLER
jgi:two-component system cell cycle sensor histidine kinase/response regulator CckA